MSIVNSVDKLDDLRKHLYGKTNENGIPLWISQEVFDNHILSTKDAKIIAKYEEGIEFVPLEKLQAEAKEESKTFLALAFMAATLQDPSSLED